MWIVSETHICRYIYWNSTFIVQHYLGLFSTSGNFPQSIFIFPWKLEIILGHQKSSISILLPCNGYITTMQCSNFVHYFYIQSAKKFLKILENLYPSHFLSQKTPLVSDWPGKWKDCMSSIHSLKYFSSSHGDDKIHQSSTYYILTSKYVRICQN